MQQIEMAAHRRESGKKFEPQKEKIASKRIFNEHRDQSINLNPINEKPIRSSSQKQIRRNRMLQVDKLSQKRLFSFEGKENRGSPMAGKIIIQKRDYSFGGSPIQEKILNQNRDHSFGESPKKGKIGYQKRDFSFGEKQNPIQEENSIREREFSFNKGEKIVKENIIRSQSCEKIIVRALDQQNQIVEEQKGPAPLRLNFHLPIKNKQVQVKYPLSHFLKIQQGSEPVRISFNHTSPNNQLLWPSNPKLSNNEPNFGTYPLGLNSYSQWPDRN